MARMMDRRERTTDEFPTYIGDVNLEHGGTFYCLDEVTLDNDGGWADFLEVMPDPENDESYWLQRGTVYLDNRESNRSAMASCGWEHEGPLPWTLKGYALLLCDTVKSYGSPVDYEDGYTVVWQPSLDEDGKPWYSERPDEDQRGVSEVVTLDEDTDLLTWLYDEGWLDRFDCEPVKVEDTRTDEERRADAERAMAELLDRPVRYG